MLTDYKSVGGGHGIFNVRNDLNIARCAHEDQKVSTSLHKSAGSEELKHGPSPCLDLESKRRQLLSLDHQRIALNHRATLCMGGSATSK